MSLPLNDPEKMEDKSSLEGLDQTTPLEKPEPALPTPANDPPDGGLKAWLQVVGSFFLFFNTWYVGAAHDTSVPPLT